MDSIYQDYADFVYKYLLSLCHDADTAEELNQLEYELSLKYDVVNSDDWYNLCYGGYSTNGFKFSDETKKVLSEKAKRRYAGSNNPMYGVHRKLTEEHKRKI